MRVALATDAWTPQVNGVVRTLTETVDRLRLRGNMVETITPDQFRTMACPGYGEIRLAIAPRFNVHRRLRAFAPDIVHIATEGPIGWCARSWCLANDIPFTSAFHTRFPDYAALRTGLSPDFFWPIMRRFHGPSRAVLASTHSLMQELADRGIAGTQLWTRGIDVALFRPDGAPHPLMADLPKPIMLSVGRVAIEKNLESFLACPVEGTKVIVGDGPALPMLRQSYPDAIFLGMLEGEALASAYRAADLFVFPSRTDTFGLVMIEALACGVPVAAYPVKGPLDVLGSNGRGLNDHLDQPVAALDEDLARAISGALMVNRNKAAIFGKSFDWETSTDQFVGTLRNVLAFDRTLAA